MSSDLTPDYGIIVVDGLVDNSSCDFDVQLLVVVGQFKTVRSVIFMTFSVNTTQELADYTIYDDLVEPLGGGLLDNRHPAANLTLVIGETILDLLQLPLDAVITVTSNPSACILFFTGTSWQTMRWVFFVCYALCFIYSIYAFAIGLKLNLYRFLKKRPLSLFLCILTSA